MRAGGAAVARSLGGVHVNADDGDLKRQRLLNIVEEMAIAARIRKPQVFVLPDEAGINAFAAGHSPDEAAVAVTQGALDALDRDQLQAVIGHEFSHILNGDMKINMRLTAWIFGLFVITDLARRFMRRRGGGKGAARAQGRSHSAFSSPAASGMLAGRLLQAAVSRRREHLADASSVQFTRNPQALQGAFVIMAAARRGHASRARSVRQASRTCSSPAASRRGLTSSAARGSPRIRRSKSACARIDARVTPLKFRTLVSDEQRKQGARESHARRSPRRRPHGAPTARRHAPWLPAARAWPMAIGGVRTRAPLSRDEPARPAACACTDADTGAGRDHAVRRAHGRRSRVAARCVAQSLEPGSTGGDRRVRRAGGEFTVAVQATFVATMLAAEPAKWRTQLTRLAPLLGIELFKETQAQIARIAQLAPASRLPLLTDLLTLLDGLEPARSQATARDRARVRAHRGDRRHAAFLAHAHAREAARQGGGRSAAGAAARTRGRGLRAVCGAGAVPLRRRQAGAERLSRRPHGHVAAAEVGAVSGHADHARRARQPRWPRSRRSIPPASVRSPKAWRA